MTDFSVGDRVLVKRHHRIAAIRAFHPEDSSLAILDRAVRGFIVWRVSELKRASPETRKPAVTEVAAGFRVDNRLV